MPFAFTFLSRKVTHTTHVFIFSLPGIIFSLLMVYLFQFLSFSLISLDGITFINTFKEPSFKLTSFYICFLVLTLIFINFLLHIPALLACFVIWFWHFKDLFYFWINYAYMFVSEESACPQPCKIKGNRYPGATKGCWWPWGCWKPNTSLPHERAANALNP